MTYPRITIVTPSFNKGDYLPRTIESVINQKYPNLEYLILDAGSTDASREIIKNYASENPEIKYFFQKDRGQWDAVNIGFHKATGDLLGYINADDLYTDETFKQIAGAFAHHPSALWFAGKSQIIDDHGHPAYRPVNIYKDVLLEFNQRTFLLMVNYLMQPSVFITRRAFSQIGDFIGVGKYIMEYDSWLRLADLHMPVVIPKKLSYFRMSLSMASLNSTDQLLKTDAQIADKYTTNLLLRSLHHLHNRLRITYQKSILSQTV